MKSVFKLLSVMALMMVFAVCCQKPIEPDDGGDNHHPTDSITHAFVDLGLPSGLLWATCNIGASSPEEVGDYFAWGDTSPKEMYDWKNYPYCSYAHDRFELTKYCTDSCWGFNGIADHLTVLESEDDAAAANWDEGWRMPTSEDYDELIQNTQCIWTTMNGVNGRLFTAKNGNSVFFPATGFRLDGELICTNLGVYWSSSLQTNCQVAAWSLHFDYGNMHVCGTYERSRGQIVRAVYIAKQQYNE